ncbi:hypothetical protein HMPREF9135_0308 [Segatella baroniae F0067]|uniref:Uncharacterized protein n=1 Tax=Segatella baroniae F0067 TaxID=1115809 RepID=U2P6G3_9BACT|nr:hypothetical protein HMPREF9135_0308 [Segatella baroniae F0067]
MQGESSPFSAQKGSFCNAKGLRLKSHPPAVIPPATPFNLTPNTFFHPFA